MCVCVCAWYWPPQSPGRRVRRQGGVFVPPRWPRALVTPPVRCRAEAALGRNFACSWLAGCCEANTLFSRTNHTAASDESHQSGYFCASRSARGALGAGVDRSLRKAAFEKRSATVTVVTAGAIEDRPSLHGEWKLRFRHFGFAHAKENAPLLFSFLDPKRPRQ